MPQASEELRAQWRHSDVDGGDVLAIGFLVSQGYRLRRDGSWEWDKPTPEHVPSEREISAACYLIEEWDFGGIADA